MIAKWTPRHVALIDSVDVQRIQLSDRLERVGCMPELFANASELLKSLGRGRRFDLLLMVESGNLAWNQLSAVCAVIGMPALLLARESVGDQCTRWLQDFPVSPLFDFASVDSQNDELHRRMVRLLHRAGEHHDEFAEIKKTVFGGYVFDEGLQSVVHQGCEISLQPRQFDLALELFRNLDLVLERHQLWASLWGAPFPPHGGRALDVCVASVRRKLRLCAENGFTLNAVYKRGYRLLAVSSADIQHLS